MKKLADELRRRQKMAQKLGRMRAKLANELANIDRQIRDTGVQMSVTMFGGTRTRPKNSQYLNEALREVLKGKTMSVTEVAHAVQKAGYNTNAANFRAIVNQCLIKNSRMFKKVSRGQYTARVRKASVPKKSTELHITESAATSKKDAA